MNSRKANIQTSNGSSRRTCRLVSARVSIVLGLSVAGACASMSLGGNPLDFNDEAVSRGFDYDLGVNVNGWGAGILLVDLDLDGDLDIVIGGSLNDDIGIYENDGTGHFTDHTATSGMTNGIDSNGLSCADYDNDGDLDIYVNGWLDASKFYRNDGNFQFTDVTVASGLDLTSPAMGSAWGDIDNDGYLDLYVAVRTFTNVDPTRNQFYKNNGDGTFTEMAAALGIQAEDDPTLVCTFFDYDRDGDDDLYLGTDKGHLGAWWNRLYRNDGGSFTEITAETNAYAYVDCMGIALGDLNYDGFWDMYVTNVTDGNKLLMHDGVSQYVDQTVPAGVGSYFIGWGTVFADFDNDTELDLYVCNMMGPNRLYRGSQAWPLVDEGPSAAVNVSNNVFCVAVGDIDGDNDLDMVVGDTLEKAHLYINNSADAATNNFARFDVVGNNANVHGIGTVVEIQTGTKAQIREVRAGENYKAQNEYTMHFGLGEADVVDTITIKFPGGETRTLTGAPANRQWILYPQGRLGDANGNGKIDWFELKEAVSLRTAPGDTIKPGQEIYDMDGDFDIDLNDLAEMGLGIRTPKVFRP
ncbi:MAG: CRTAC1 family protein [Phycisphaerales bacterium]